MLCGVYFFARLARREFETAGRFALWCFFALALAVGLFPWCLNHIFGAIAAGAPSRARRAFG